MTHSTKLAPFKIPATELHAFGEFSLPQAPHVTVFERIDAIPQQFFRVQRNLTQLENLVTQITVPFEFMLFVGKLSVGYYLQVGIIGEENYPTSVVSAYASGQSDDNHQVKIVYGRRWLIEESTPSSEVLQTALLAVQKAREHELREKLSIIFNTQEQQGTPFNSHQDAPLMRHVKRELQSRLSETISDQVSRLRFDGHRFSVTRTTPVSPTQTAFELDFDIPAHGRPEFSRRYPEFAHQTLLVVCDPLQANQFLHRVVEAMLTQSQRYTCENTRFSGFPRFGSQINAVSLARFSYQTRRPAEVSAVFHQHFKRMSQQVDGDKVPSINANELGAQQRAKLALSGVQQGHLPYDYEQEKAEAPKTKLSAQSGILSG
ncbi:hypothetical protein GCM10008090_00500 [Arenicella chitinivorans]|uniref:Uncharacterized protein n=1 Tax=Arenicella chitinivorans TaxID=1329800 RepID=A0A918REY6_9GAMM|nr:hypothetical protein [Arenicella chitinivorans]GGZ96195.1 hypothetical protein GCM10008090_00500 [Arenicella chitinivorans]